MYRRECERSGEGWEGCLKYDMFYIWDHYMEWLVRGLDVRRWRGERMEGG